MLAWKEPPFLQYRCWGEGSNGNADTQCIASLLVRCLVQPCPPDAHTSPVSPPNHTLATPPACCRSFRAIGQQHPLPPAKQQKQETVTTQAAVVMEASASTGGLAVAI